MLDQTTDFLSLHCSHTPRLDAEVLLAHVLKTDRTGLYLAFPNPVTEKEQEVLQGLLSRRIKGEPVSYLLGRKEFWSFTFRVNRAVMIPRPETELLVEETLKIFPAGSSPSVLELGTGSGAISIALAAELPGASIIATDISPDALAVARENALCNGVNGILFFQGNLYEPCRDKKEDFDLIISNPPYIPANEVSSLPPGIRDYEPHCALDGGADGLEFHRRIIQEAHQYLQPGGYLLLEFGEGQGHEVAQIISNNQHLSVPFIIRDLSGIERVVKAYRQ